MTLFKLKAVPLIILEDDMNINMIPLILEMIQHEKNTINFFCYEQPVSNWKNVFKEKTNIVYHECYDPDRKYTNNNCSIIIDSVNQMSLCIGWNQCLNNLKNLSNDPNVVQIILILHKDCLSHFSKLQIQLNHIASAIVCYDDKNPFKIHVQLKKNGKLFKSKEMLSFDIKQGVLNSAPIIKEETKEEDTAKPIPENLSTFKIEVEQKDKLEKYKLKLPYMSKINEGESKVYYEPDAVDDWDEEDPDEDLDI